PERSGHAHAVGMRNLTMLYQTYIYVRLSIEVARSLAQGRSVPMSVEPDVDLPHGLPAVRHSVVRVRGLEARDWDDDLAVEDPLEIGLGGISLAVTMRTPGDDEELIAGFLFSEGIITSADDLDVVARYRGPADDPERGSVMNVLLRGNIRVAR